MYIRHVLTHEEYNKSWKTVNVLEGDSGDECVQQRISKYLSLVERFPLAPHFHRGELDQAIEVVNTLLDRDRP